MTGSAKRHQGARKKHHREQYASRESQTVPNETLRLVGALDEVEEFERKNRKDAGHQIEDQAA